MKSLTLTLFFTLICIFSYAQDKRIDSLKHQLSITNLDTNYVLTAAELSNLYSYFNTDSAVIYANKGLIISQKIKFFRGEVRNLIALSGSSRQRGEIPESLEILFRALRLAEEKGYLLEEAMCLNNIGDIYWDLKDFSKSISFCKRAQKLVITRQADQKYYDLIFLTNLYIGTSYSKMEQLDSAYAYLKNNYDLTSSDETMHPVAMTYLSEVLFKQGHPGKAFAYIHQAIRLNMKNNDRNTNTDAYKIIAEFFRKIGESDSVIYYAKKGLIDAQQIGYKLGILDISKLLANQYYSKNSDTAYHYLQLAMSVNDELYGAKKVQDLQNIITNEQQRISKVELDKIAYKNQSRQYALLAGLGIMFLIGIFLYRNNYQKQRTNIALQEQKEKIESALAQLKSTQTQLIQREKMASLGELTAGIAHEIQNPLNFVNNFSEVSAELVTELEEEQQKLDRDTNLEAEILVDLKQNLQKITHHGGRASAIVKGMLEHSSTGTGEKRPTDLNALADEYLKIAYHGLRRSGDPAKDKNESTGPFNAELKTDFLPNLGKVEVIPQELGRVLLNLYNNAFYAVQQRAKNLTAGASDHSQDLQSLEHYQPTVTVSTTQLNGQIQIRVADNGVGIPDAAKVRIFQPFFTTKPTGEGTGLGLSLSYDIVTKGHGGSLTVESLEGQGTEFVIHLPTASVPSQA